MTTDLKIESGLQLFARLTKTFDFSKFYPVLFEGGLKPNDIVELNGDVDCCKSLLLIELISQTILPKDFGGLNTGILLFNIDGNICFKTVVCTLREKIRNTSGDVNNMSDIIEKALSKLYLLNIFDSEQFQTTIENLENILADNPVISLIALDTLTAFYWSEQQFKLTKMDLYLKSYLKSIQKSTQEQKLPIIYTRPLYFGSRHDITKRLDATFDYITHRLNISKNCNDNGISYEVIKQSHNSLDVKYFTINNSLIEWIVD